MPFCKHCGVELKEGTKFCPHCGAPVGAEEIAKPRPPPTYAKEREACFGPKGSGGGLWGAISAAVFVIGLGILWFLDSADILHWWPGILFLIGVMVLIGGLVAYARGS